MMLAAAWILASCTPPSEDTGADSATDPSSACDTVPEGDVVLPLDEAPHDEDVEWWYWTGHLQDEAGRWYGFEHVYFSFVFGSSTAMMVHHALTDVDAQDFDFLVDYQMGASATAPAEGGFSFSMGDQNAAGANGSDHLHGETGSSVLDLDLVATKAPVLQHSTGYTEYPFGGYTYYYSRPRMTAEGTLQIDGETREVSGTGWFDHQWGALAEAVGMGWDWFALQLDDGREIMVFLLRPEDGDLLAGATVTDADCNSVEEEEVTVTATGEWTSPTTGCTFPMGWDLSVGGETFTVTPVMEDQEIGTDYQVYWEGAATVSGSATGRAYVELTEYCE